VGYDKLLFHEPYECYEIMKKGFVPWKNYVDYFPNILLAPHIEMCSARERKITA
jgi:hypothetical protein